MTVTEAPAGTSGDAPLPRPSMGIDPWEKNWMRLSVALLVVFFATVTIGGFAMGFQVQGAEDELDPATLLQTPPWDEPGLRQIADGEYEAYVVAQAWTFSPREIEVPVGSKLTLYVASPDVQHGFKITDTNVNMQVVPGQVSKLSFTFDTVGEFPYICTEYCGQGHAAMSGLIRVVPANADSGDESGAPSTTGAGTATEEGTS